MEQPNTITSQGTIRVMIFDSSRMGCQLLSNMLERCSYSVKVTGCCIGGTLKDGLSLQDANIALITSNVGDAPGSRMKLLREVRHSNSSVRCVMLLEECGKEEVIEAFTSGAMGICSRQESCEVLCQCIDRVYHEQIWANSEQLRNVLEALWAANRVHLIVVRGNSLLTRREEDIVYLVAEGLRNREIAEQLKLSAHTVRNYLFRIFKKLDLSSRSELILYSVEQRRKKSVSA